MKLQEYFSCARKIRYRSKKAAAMELRRIGKSGKIVPPEANAYRCKFCGGWHLGHNKQKKEVSDEA